MPLCHIINWTLLTGIVPSIHKIAKVVQIYKNGRRDDPYNYRPVSILPGFSNIQEELIANRLLAFLEITFSININLDQHLVEMQLMPCYHLLTM